MDWAKTKINKCATPSAANIRQITIRGVQRRFDVTDTLGSEARGMESLNVLPAAAMGETVLESVSASKS